MKFRKLLLGLVFSSVLFAACDKNDEVNEVANKLQHRWAVTDALSYAAQPINDTVIYYMGTPADFIDFRSNGTVITSLQGEVDTSNYTLMAGNKIVVDTDTADIRLLTDAKLQLYTVTLDSGVELQTTINLTR